MEMLRVLRESMNISEDIHNKMEEEIMLELNNNDSSPSEPVQPRENEDIMGDDMHLLIQESSSPEAVEEIVEAPAEALAPPAEEPPTTSKKLMSLKIKKNITLGKEKYRKNDCEGALKFFSQCQELEPDNEEVKFLIKKTKMKLKAEKRKKGSKPEPNVGEVQPATTISRTDSPLPAIPLDDSVAQSDSIPIAPAAIPVSESGEPISDDAPPESTPDITQDNNKCVSCEGNGKCYWCNGSSKCDRCNGSGLFNNEPCTICGGSGDCNSCSGSGLCPWCKGSGTREVTRVALPNMRRD